MHIAVFALVLSLLNPSAAYLVNVPGDNHGWHAFGPQSLSWNRVDTDPKSFAVVLTNQDRRTLPRDILIGEHVDGARLGSIKIYPPPGGFPAGAHFRVNLVKSAQDPNTIFAQSNEFTISK